MHTHTDSTVFQRHAKAAQRGDKKSIAWLDRRGWSPEQAKRFIRER